MTNNTGPETVQENPTTQYEHLARFVEIVEDAVAQEDYVAAERFIETDAASAWFGFRTERLYEIVGQLVAELSNPGFFLSTIHRVMTDDHPGDLYSAELLAGSDVGSPQQRFFLAVFRMSAFRTNGLHKEVIEQAEAMREEQGRLISVFDRHGGWALNTSVQLGISAMLYGDFTRALSAFTEAQLHVEVPAFAFLTRDALVKAALIHASFGDPEEAKILLARAERIPRASSWAEPHIDVHRDFAKILLSETPEVAINQLEQINLHEIGELWPFYIVAIHRLWEATGYRDALEHQLQIFETLPLPMQKGHGFSGSVVSVKRALLALSSGRGTQAQELFDHADPDIPYTQLMATVTHLYAGRPKEALQRATQLRQHTAGLRLLEIRRLAITASAHLASQNVRECISVLEQAAAVARGLTTEEVRLFSPEVRLLAERRVSAWPQDEAGASLFLTNLPEPGEALSERETIIIQHLSQGHTRAQIAEKLFISVNTVKSQLTSAYRKLNASSAAAATIEAERRGLL